MEWVRYDTLTCDEYVSILEFTFYFPARQIFYSSYKCVDVCAYAYELLDGSRCKKHSVKLSK